MDVRQLLIQPRPRSPWQVFDITVLCYRKMAPAMMLLWLLPALPLAILISLLFNPNIALLVVWWLKPLFEKPLLHYASRAIFSESVDWRQSLRSMFQGGWQRLLLNLTFLRFSWRRAYLAPVSQLEGLTGKRYQQRVASLTRLYDDRQGYWLLFCVHLELLIVLALGIVLYAAIPQGIEIEWQFIFELLQSDVYAWLLSFAYLLAFVLVAPLFVLGGFMMYLNRRIVLEAWDLELIFRRLAARLKSVSVMLLCLFVCYAGTSEPVLATQAVVPDTVQTDNNNVYDEQRAAMVAEQIRQIYQERDIIAYKTERKSVDEKDRDLSDPGWNDWPSLTGILHFLSSLLGYLGWILALTVLVILSIFIYRIRDKLWLSGSKKVEAPIAFPLFFADLPEEVSGDRLLILAREYWQDNNNRLALACLLKYALGYVQQYHAVRLNATMTEQECLQTIQSTVPVNICEAIAQLIRLWTTVAWAHRMVNADDVLQLISTVECWPVEQEAV